MAKISFRQGIVSHPKNTSSGTQTFLKRGNNGTDVNLVLDESGSSSEPVVVTFTHQDTDYLYTESKSITKAWSGLPSGDAWLFWELNLSTGQMERGFTEIEPITSSRQPKTAQRVAGLMWHDTNESVFKVWSGTATAGSWREVVRVLAARYNGTTFLSLSDKAVDGNFEGTQIGVNLGRQKRRAGALVYNKSGKAIKSGDRRQFFTTEDKFLAGVPTGASLRINNNVITGTAATPLAAYQVVQFNSYDSIIPANAYEQGDKLFGIVESDIETSEQATFVTEGIIYNELWSWQNDGHAVNTPVYVHPTTRKFTVTKSAANNAPVGVIMGNREIYFAPRLFPQVNLSVTTGSGLSAAQLAQINNATTVSQQNATDIGVLDTDLDALTPRVAQNEADIIDLRNGSANGLPLSGGTMTGQIELPSGNPTLPVHAASKAYVDSRTSGYQVSFAAAAWVGASAEKSIAIPQTTHGLPSGKVYDIVVIDSTTNRAISIDYGIDVATGLVTLYTLGQPFAGVLRIK